MTSCAPEALDESETGLAPFCNCKQSDMYRSSLNVVDFLFQF